jgi:hypothetical protein
MTSIDRSSLRKVLMAAFALVLFAVLLGLRLGRRIGVMEARPLTIGGAVVPAPAPIQWETLRFPCWACNTEAYSWPIQYKTNLDLIAPLGTGTENAARWFADFAKPNGARAAEGEAAMKRRFEVKDLGSVFPPDDRLLREAEPWCDQATMRFYPDVFAFKGSDTQIPNLLLALGFAKSWIAEGQSSPDPKQAMEDFRRAIRLGRLLRQDDAVVISDLVGLACIRLGTKGIYDLARRQGDINLALAASLVLGEGAPQRLRTAEQLTQIDVMPYLSGPDPSHVTLALPDRKLDEIVTIATKDPDRRFRFESMMSLNIVRFLGAPAQQERAAETLASLAKSDDPGTAREAEWARDTPPSPDRFEALFSDKVHGMR